VTANFRAFFWAAWRELAAPLRILALGRLLSSIGSGFTLFYLPIVFVNQVGLSATDVGLGLGFGSLAGVGGRILGGSLTDSRRWGRRPTLLLAVGICTLSAFGLAVAHNFPVFVVSNAWMGFGVGLYWPASEAMVADLASLEQRQTAFALTRLADNLGLGLGIILGGALMSQLSQAYWALFVGDGISFAVFFGLVYLALGETQPPADAPVRKWWASWRQALRDRKLRQYVFVNVLLTLYISQIHSTLPLYFTNFANVTENGKGFAPLVLSGLLTWHLWVAIALQLPIAKALRSYGHIRGLMVSTLFWGLGFLLVAVTGVAKVWPLVWAALSLAVLAIATVAYTPSASALVVDLAPTELRGVYLSINSLCWAVGYAIGPPLGGWALDQPRPIADYFWLGLAFTIGLALAILSGLQRQLQKHPPQDLAE
jgi:MFS family permease